jgi:hypothetical protein
MSVSLMMRVNRHANLIPTLRFGPDDEKPNLYKSTVLHVTYFHSVKEKQARQLLFLPQSVPRISRLLQERSKQATSDTALHEYFR